jgi:phosphoribosylanthranilate isomerase
MRYIKICGIRNLIDAQYCIRCGANAIGVIVGALHKTEDELGVFDAELIFRRTNGNGLYKVMVTHIEDPDRVEELAKRTGCNTIQIHSYMPVEDIRRLRRRFSGTLIGMAHGNSSDVLDRVDELVKSHAVDMVIIDTKTNDRFGGTGIAHDWIHTARIVQKYPDTKFILAGGLNPDNVATAIKTVSPFGVDVNSGVKRSDGLKDYRKVESFVKAVKAI